MSGAEFSERYRVSERTIKNWRAKGAPLHSESEMAKWAETQKNLPAGFRNYLEARKSQSLGTPPAGEGSSEWDRFLAEAKASAAGEQPKQSLAAIMQARDFTAFRFREAAKANQRDNMKFYADLLAKFEGVVHDSELRAKKLGIDQGELLPRALFTELISAHAYWTMRSTDLALDVLDRRLVNLASPRDARTVLEPELLSIRFVQAYAHAAKIAARNSLPAWALDHIRDTVDDFIENGAALFDRSMAEQAKEP